MLEIHPHFAVYFFYSCCHRSVFFFHIEFNTLDRTLFAKLSASCIVLIVTALKWPQASNNWDVIWHIPTMPQKQHRRMRNECRDKPHTCIVVPMKSIVISIEFHLGFWVYAFCLASCQVYITSQFAHASRNFLFQLIYLTWTSCTHIQHTKKNFKLKYLQCNNIDVVWKFSIF